MDNITVSPFLGVQKINKIRQSFDNNIPSSGKDVSSLRTISMNNRLSKIYPENSYTIDLPESPEYGMKRSDG
jgi:hypothetical protein